jgi:ArsR family transcriptional regulator, lead/cadmium/zinc/bismuth-responsive transcriptional repressor
MFTLKLSIMKLEITCTRAEADIRQIVRCQELLNTNSSSIEDIIKILALVGNKVRLQILYLLDKEKELCPCDLADILEMSVPAVSQHIRKMKDSDIVTARREGQTLYYSIVENKYEILGDIFSLIDVDAKIAV